MDIHVGIVNPNINIDRGIISIFFHIPVENKINGIVPTPESAIKDLLTSDENDALASGDLVEIIKSVVVVLPITSKVENIMKDKMKSVWQDENVCFNRRYDMMYSYFGVKFDAS